jgi:hypothetical protein
MKYTIYSYQLYFNKEEREKLEKYGFEFTKEICNKYTKADNKIKDQIKIIEIKNIEDFIKDFEKIIITKNNEIALYFDFDIDIG